MSDGTIELLTSADFVRTLIIASLVLVAGVGGAFLIRRPLPTPVGGICFAAAFVIAIPSRFGPGVHEIVGFAALAVAGSIVAPLPVRFVLAVPGSVLVALTTAIDVDTDLRILVIVLVAAASALVADFDTRYRASALGPPLFTLATVGAFFGVPDTEQALYLLAAAVPLLVGAWPRPLFSLGGPGAAAAVGALGWVALVGSAGRTPVVVGVMAALGILVAEPLVHRLRRDGTHALTSLGPLVVGAIQLGVVYVASRWAAPRTSVIASIGFAVLALAIAAGASGASQLLSDEFA